MSIKKISKLQPELFEFTSENLEKAKNEISKYPKKKKASAVLALLYLAQNQSELSQNKLCSWTEVECLGACVNAPMMQVNQDYFEDLDENKTEEIVLQLLNNNFPSPGSAKNRKNNAPKKGKTTLIDIKNA